MLYRLKHGSLTFYIGEYNVMYSYSTDSEYFNIGLPTICMNCGHLIYFSFICLKKINLLI
jgi:hypothetical protein